jgi:hypothetical protein
MHQTLFVIEVRNGRTGEWSPATRHRSRQEAVDLLRTVSIMSETRIKEITNEQL